MKQKELKVTFYDGWPESISLSLFFGFFFVFRGVDVMPPFSIMTTAISPSNN